MSPSAQVVHRPSFAPRRAVLVALFGVLLTLGLAAPVVASGQPPVASDLSVMTTVSTPVDIFLEATDDEDDVLTFVIVGDPSHGTIGGPECADSGVCTYTPTTGYVGGDSFTWKANDGTSDSNVATVTITVTPLTSHKILSAGPLTRIEITNDLNCAVDHTGDGAPEFYGDTACGSLVAVGGTLYGPAEIPAGGAASPLTPFTPVSQTDVLGSGSVGDPYRIVTVVDLGTTGLHLTETDAYVVGQETYRTDVQIASSAGTPVDAILYRAGDCYLQNSDRGFGAADSATGAVSCVAGVNDGTGTFVPGTRIEQWYPLSAGSSYYEAFYSSVWAQIGSRMPFANSCEQCASYVDNGAGLSWNVTIPVGGSVTRSHLTVFSPLGIVPLTTTKTAALPSVTAGRSDGYTITIANPNTSPATLTSITDTLPAGFTYSAGSTTGATTTNPGVAGQVLTWTGPFTVPASGTITLTFGVTVSTTPGTYPNQAGAAGQSPFVVIGTGQTAPVTVIAAAHLTLTKLVSGGTALPTAWTLSASGPTPISGHSGDPAITAAAVDAGTYTLAEGGGPTGYSAGAWGCTGGNLSGSSLVLAAGETASCSITNTVIPPAAAHLTLTKLVSGGTALPTAWTLSASGPTPISGHSGDPAITAAAVDAGTYTLAEGGGPTGYSAGAWGCTGGNLSGSSLVLAAGESASCSITNTVIPPAAAHLTLTKLVSGGTALPTAWTLSASGPTPISGHSGDPAITAAAVDAGTYTLAEGGGPTGYSAGAWGCTGGNLSGSSLVLAAGESASCSITNTVIPPAAAHLTLTKLVSGGTALPTAWTLSASGPTPISGHSGDPAITAAAVDAGTYTLAEGGGPTGYSAGAWGCTGGNLSGSSLVLAAGETASCSITNTVIPPAAAHLTLTKLVSGGTALPTAWTLSASGPTPISGHSGDPAITAAAVDAGTYTLAEGGGPTGYSAGAWGCTGGNLSGSSLVLAAGETASCSITNTVIPPAAAHLTLTKLVSGGTALPTAWTLSASGPTPISGHSGDPAITAAAVDAGTYTLAEGGGPTGYSAGAWGCTGGNLSGSSLVLAAGESASCSITNTVIPPAAAHLTLTKLVSGGTALPTAWTLSASGPTPISGHSGDPAITAAAVDAGTYTLAEGGGPTGYSAGAWGCTGGNLSGSSLVLAAGESASCSITNTVIPPAAAHLTLTKLVSGGTALPTAWTLSASGPTPISGHSGDPAITAAAVDAGTYTLAEGGGPTGYSAGAWGCTGGNLSGSSLVLAAGESASCSITNTVIPPAAAHLTLTKLVSGGTALPTAWTLSASGPTPISGHSGDPAITAAAVDAGTYTLAEGGGPTGYSAGAWGCTGGNLSGSSLVLAAGESASCSITNTVIPPAAAHLTLTKLVSGGTALPTAWTLSASGPTPISGHSGDPAITAAAVDAGTYTLAEGGGPTGYSAGAWGCTGGNLSGSSLVLAAGESASCSITNTVIPPAAAHLTLTKLVSGGTALPTAWTLSASGPTPISGHSGDPAITAAAVDAGTYTLAEGGGPTGYSAGAWGCTGGNLSGSSLVLAAGESASCSITNTVIPPAAAHLTLTKLVSGGTALPTAWTLSASGPTPISGHSGDPAITAAAVDAGTYTLAEGGGPTGYSAGAWGCTGGNLSGSSLVLAAGESASCSITNTVIPPAAAHLTLTKLVSGGTALPTAWTLSASGPTPISGHSGDPAITAAAVDAGTYTLAEGGGPTGYSAGAWGCTGGNLSGSSLVLAAGESASCSITNTVIPPAAAHLTLTKLVSGGTALPTAWTLSASGPTPISGHSGDPAITAAAVDAGTYTLAEGGGPTGYSAGAWGCTGGNLSGSSLVLAAGESASCSITNTVIPPAAAHLTLTKLVSGGTALPTAWTLSASGPTPISGHSGDPAITAAAVDAGTYTLAEGGGPTGYSAGAWGCTGGNLSGSSLVLAAGESASCSITNTLSAYLQRGAFVIGDDGADLGATVTWWGPQWARDNVLTGGPAPASFKGFAASLDPAPPVVGGTWTTRPGASSNPPNTVPAYMAVIVTSSVTKDGSSISGNIVRIVLVKTGPVFGTGTIVAILSQ